MVRRGMPCREANISLGEEITRNTSAEGAVRAGGDVTVHTENKGLGGRGGLRRNMEFRCPTP